MVVVTPENLIGGPNAWWKTKRGQALRRYKGLEDNRSSWRSHWMELSDYLMPRRGRYLSESRNSKGRKRNNKIIDSTGTMALRTLRAGMVSGMTNPARPWFKYKPRNEDLMSSGPVKKWLEQAERAVRARLHRTGFYTAIDTFYGEMGGFGTACLFRQPSRDMSKRVVYRPWTAGEYVIDEDDEGQINTVAREFDMTVAQIVAQFVVDPMGDPAKADWGAVSRVVRNLWDQGNYEAELRIVHMVQPRAHRRHVDGLRTVMDMPYADVYFEYGAEGDQVLRESGHERFPAFVGRWDVLANGDVYGRSPGMDALGDIKQLQLEQKRKAQALDKLVNPPMTASPSLKGRPTTTLPGGTTYVDTVNGQPGFQPTYQVQPRLNEMMQDIQEIQQRIERVFYADLFAMLIMSDRRQITATEIAERHEEKLLLLGPVLQRTNADVLSPLLDDALIDELQAGAITEPPQELHGENLDIKYISLLAQAQEAAAAVSIERGMSFAGNMAGVYPDITDNVDSDQALRDYFDIVGVPADHLRTPEQVEDMRDAKREQIEGQQAMEGAGQAADIAQRVAGIETQQPNALTNILQAAG
jgi:hypothetical protein